MYACPFLFIYTIQESQRERERERERETERERASEGGREGGREREERKEEPSLLQSMEQISRERESPVDGRTDSPTAVDMNPP